MNDKIIIREIEVSDYSIIAELNQELGYQLSSPLIERQLKTILSKNDHYGYVASIEGQVIGYIHGFISIRLTTEPFAEIGGLVVDERYRKKGIGRILLNHLEQQINEFAKMRVRCNVKRDSAHEFYLSLNFLEKKEQKVFDKELHTTKPTLH